MSDIYWIFLAVCLGIVVFQLLYTRSHRKNLEEHEQRIAEIYDRYRR